jgi:hypothetical protein
MKRHDCQIGKIKHKNNIKNGRPESPKESPKGQNEICLRLSFIEPF